MSSPAAPTPHAAESVAMLETMMLIRAHEERLASLASPTAPGTCTAVGQEAAAVGVVRALEARDRILTNHRSAGHLIARGADPGRLMAEAMGRVDGYCKGKSGSLHVSAASLGVVLTSTIVGGELSLAPGVALAQKMGRQAPGGITAVFFGDGAACEGIFHESVNLAVTWQLPVLYVCENNQWQAYVHRRETMPMDHVSQWAASHGIATMTVDGNDVEAVYYAALAGIAHIRATGQPYLLETYTYRTRGHVEPDDQGYVDPAELAAWRARDPIELIAARLALTPSQLQAARERAATLIEDAWTTALAAPYPAASELLTDVYA